MRVQHALSCSFYKMIRIAGHAGQPAFIVLRPPAHRCFADRDPRRPLKHPRFSQNFLFFDPALWYPM